MNWDGLLKGATYAALGIAGTLLGVYGSFTYATSLQVTVAVVLVNFVLVRLAGLGSGRTGAVIVALTWLTSVMVLTMPRSKGDVIFPSDIPGQVYLFLLGGSALAGLAIYLTPATRSFLTGLPHDHPSSRSR
ncbi:hypothetical protein GCM10027589_37760 [Actinocorallia lasiicapitis]